MKISNGFFGATVRQRLCTLQSPRLPSLEVTVRCRRVSSHLGVKCNGTSGYPFAELAEYGNDCAGAEQTFRATTAGNVRSNSSSRDTLTKQIRSIANSSSGSSGCNTFGNVTAPTKKCACLNDLFTATGVPRSCIGGTEGAILRNSPSRCSSGTARPVRTALTHLAGNNSLIRTSAAELYSEHSEVTTMDENHGKVEIYTNSASNMFQNARTDSPICEEASAERVRIASQVQVTELPEAARRLQRITKKHLFASTSASPVARCSCFSERLPRRLHGTHGDPTSSKDALDRHIPPKTSSWLLLGGLRVLAPFTSFATRNSFFATNLIQAGCDFDTSNCGFAGLLGKQSASAHDARGTSSLVDAQQGGKKGLDATESTSNARAGSGESCGPSVMRENPLSGGIAMQNSEVSQVKLAQGGQTLEKSNGSSHPWFKLPFSNEAKSKKEALPNTKLASSVKDTAAPKSAKISLSKKLGSFLFGFLLASGCSFFIMYCQVADATLILQQTAKDATHRLAVLESRLLELEKKVRSF